VNTTIVLSSTPISFQLLEKKKKKKKKKRRGELRHTGFMTVQPFAVFRSASYLGKGKEGGKGKRVGLTSTGKLLVVVLVPGEKKGGGEEKNRGFLIHGLHPLWIKRGEEKREMGPTLPASVGVHVGVHRALVA